MTTTQPPRTIQPSAPGADERPALLTPLTPHAELALLCRTLFREGYDDHLAGHITYRQADGTFLVTPWELTWDEVRASDIVRMDTDGNRLEGRWSITPAITLHTELHRARDDVTVAIHNHSRWGTIWADLQRVPPVYDQTSAAVDGEIAVFDEYAGDVANRDNAAAAVRALGDAKMALLANHGVFVVGESITQAHLRAVTLEWRCRQAWHVEAVGGGVPMRSDVAERFGSMLDRFGFPGMWEAMCRRELRADPSIID
jgi:ribulose-5-phosphate 4-epimerase/fuculose-1-phosphate aldolase